MLGREASKIRFRLQLADGAEFEIQIKQCPNDCRLIFIDNQLLIHGIVSERRKAAHPHVLLLGGSDLVADALSRNLALELGEGEQHIEGQSPHGIGSVELLGDRNEGNAAGIEGLDDLGEVHKRAG